MPIPFARDALVATEKVQRYLLNLEHPEGASKAAWFSALGYRSEAWWLLAEDLMAIARDCERFDVIETAYGVKYVAEGPAGLQRDRRSRVVTVWIVEGGGPPRLVTAYPAKEA